VQELGAATANNTQVLADIGRQFTALPALLGGLLSGAKERDGGFTGFLKKGLGIGSLIGLFRRQREPEPAVLTPFREPASLALEVANTEDILAGFPRVVRGQTSEARAVETERRTVVVQPQVTVQVNAMDSRSFLDHSAEIARAVREAMLSAHGLNDVVNEL
jgi:hypothetical protein